MVGLFKYSMPRELGVIVIEFNVSRMTNNLHVCINNNNNVLGEIQLPFFFF